MPPAQTQAKKNADFSQLSLNKPETKKPANTGTGGQPLIGPLPYHPARIKEEWTYGVNGLSRLKPGQSPAVTMVNPNQYAYLRYSHDPKQRQKQFEQEYKKQSPDKNPMQVESLGNFIGRSEAAYQQDEKAYLRELAQYEYGKYGLDDYLKINRQFTETEKEQARIFMKKFDAQTSNEFRKYAGNRDGMGAKPMPENVRILQKKREALGAKVSRGDGAFYGLMNGITFGAARNKENRSNTQYLEQYATQTTPLTPDQQAHQQILRSYGGKSSFDVAKENQAGPYFVGTALGEVGKYYVGAKLGSAAPGLGGVQKASTKLSKLTKGAISEDAFRNLIAGRVAEMPFDAAAIGADAQSWDDFAKRFAVSQLQGLAFDGMNQIMDSVQGRFAKNPFAQNTTSLDLQNNPSYSKLSASTADELNSSSVAKQFEFSDLPFGKHVVTDGSHIQNRTLKPDCTYITGEHEYMYRTNERGLLARVRVSELKQKTHDRRLRHNRKTYGKQKGDQAGHLIGDRFGGSPNLDNLVSQAQNVNLSEYRRLEERWWKEMSSGKKVSVDISIAYDKTSDRPTAFFVEYFIDGAKYQKNIKN